MRKQRAALEHHTFPVNQRVFRVLENDQPRFLLAARYTEFSGYLKESFLKADLLETGRPQLSSRIQRSWHHLLADWDPGSTGHIMQHGEGVRREPQSSTIPTPQHVRNAAWTPSHRTGGTHSQHGMMENPRHPISELHLGKFPDSGDVQCWKVNFQTEVCASTPCRTLTMSWIKEEETATSIDDLLTSQSIEGRRDFSEFEMLDAKMVSTLKKLFTHVHFRRRLSVEQQRSQKYDRFLGGRQVAYMIYDHFSSNQSF